MTARSLSHGAWWREQVHQETSSAPSAPETITFLCTDPGCPTHFYAGGTVWKLPTRMSGVTTVYLLRPKHTFHGALPVVDRFGLEVEHGNVGSALVTRCVCVTNWPRSAAASALRRLSSTCPH